MFGQSPERGTPRHLDEKQFGGSMALAQPLVAFRLTALRGAQNGVLEAVLVDADCCRATNTQPGLLR